MEQNLHENRRDAKSCQTKKISEQFESKIARHGSILSPLLFILAMDDAIKECFPEMIPFELRYYNLKNSNQSPGLRRRLR